MAIKKYPGEKWGGVIRLTYKGPGNVVWIGAGLRVNPYDYWNIPSYWWAATTATLPACSKETTIEVRVEDIFPVDIPAHQGIDIWKVIAWEDIIPKLGNRNAVDALIIDRDDDDEVYLLGPVESDWIKIVSAEPYKVKK